MRLVWSGLHCADPSEIVSCAGRSRNTIILLKPIYTRYLSFVGRATVSHISAEVKVPRFSEKHAFYFSIMLPRANKSWSTGVDANAEVPRSWMSSGLVKTKHLNVSL